MKQNSTLPILALTMGDAAGCGPEIIVKALADKSMYEICRPLVFGDAKRIEQAAKILKSPLKVLGHAKIAEGVFQHGNIDVLDFDNIPAGLPFGKISAEAGHAAYQYVESAVQAAMAKEVAGIVTAPLNKEALHLGGHDFPGHTEILGELSHSHDYAMLLASETLRVIHVTTHVSMVQASSLITKERVLRIIRLADRTLRLLGIAKPRIAVAGFNAHAGENGLFGREEVDEIVPAVEEACKAGMTVTGPISPDTVFYRAACRKEFDIVVVMYHDQGHIPIKLLGFDSGINVTVGLPFIRSSVDHGTAFDIAGQGIAEDGSMKAAIEFAARVAIGAQTAK
ncbi:4-hydroxythreonine-4-phosphate dehydrogenase PdxA [Sporomusa aerivorans]|uniref:4-hydroxythreonine-4-phosphate dehydrogenase PdxA n=1 Tax=Sporomusa aerivorans TaxID=204936 RepID=UPI00352A2ACE